MDRIKLIDEQTQHARARTKQLLNDFPEALWYNTPEGVHSNIAWQVGHLIVSQHYHSIAVIAGDHVMPHGIPLQEYIPHFAIGANPAMEGPSPEQLKTHLDLVNEAARKELFKLKEKDLVQALEPTELKHPVVLTKEESLIWNYKHELWHNGQISKLKKIVKASLK